MNHGETKQLYLAYRDRARELYALVVNDEVAKTRVIQVPIGANVGMCEDGAFVEAVVWVPRAELDKKP